MRSEARAGGPARSAGSGSLRPGRARPSPASSCPARPRRTAPRPRPAREPPRAARPRPAPIPTTVRACSRSPGSSRCRRRRGSACRRGAARPSSRGIWLGTSAASTGSAMRKRRAAALLALDRDRPAHQLDEALRDGEAEAGPAEPARRRRVDLAERREQPVHPVRWDPDPGVAHRRARAGRSRIRVGSASTRTTTSPAVGELDRVREQVQQHLAEAGLVAEDPGGRVLVDQTAELDPLLPGARRDDVQRPLHALTQVERLAFEVELAGLDLRVVEDVVDHVQQRVAARAGRPRRTRRCSPVSSVPSRRSVIPITAFIGVLISWLIVARNALFAWVAASASWRACCSSVTSW